MPRRKDRGFIWIPRPKNTQYSIHVDGVDVTTEVVSSEWTSSIIGNNSLCKLRLIDTDGAYADSLTGGEVIELKLDFNDGTTSKWKGTLDFPKRKFGDAYFLDLIGSDYQTDLLDLTVTASYDGNKTIDEILKELIDNNLDGFTYANVGIFSSSPTIQWENKPFWDCVLDLCELADADCYVDTDKDFHFFVKESITRTTDAIVWKDTLLNIEKFGIDKSEIKNKVTVYGEDIKGNPIIYETSTGETPIKEEILRDTSINTYTQAKEVGDAKLTSLQSSANEGIFNCIILPDILPGDMIWITDPPQKVHGKYRIVQYTYFLPEERVKVVISKDKTIPQLFKDRKRAELANQSLTNRYGMSGSINLTFGDYSELSTYDSNVQVLDGKLSLSSGAEGTATTTTRSTSKNITQVELRVTGTNFTTASFQISTDSGTTYESLVVGLNNLTNIQTEGSDIILKINLNSSTTEIDSLTLLYKD